MAAMRRSGGGAQLPPLGAPPHLPPPVPPPRTHRSATARSIDGDEFSAPPSALRAFAQHELSVQLPQPPGSESGRARIAAARDTVLRAATALHTLVAPVAPARGAPAVRVATQRAMEDLMAVAASGSRPFVKL
jgi:hypothetical protein